MNITKSFILSKYKNIFNKANFSTFAVKCILADFRFTPSALFYKNNEI